jgi:hypothetical protein
MIQRISATIVIAILYLFLAVQGMPRVDPKLDTLSESERQSANRISSDDLNVSNTVAMRKLVDAASAVPQPTVAHYNESQQSWTLPATVVELKDVSIYGRPGTIARIEYRRGEILNNGWIVVTIDNYSFSDNAIPIVEGQEIVLNVSGEYVDSKGVNWEACPRSDKYCEYASFIEGGFPISEDYNGLPICPSNLLVYSGYLPDDWINGMLAWKIKTSD